MAAIFSYCLRDGNESYARFRVLQDVQALLRGLGRVDRNVDGAQQQAGEVGDRPLRPVLAENDDAVALANAPGLQLARRGIHPAAQLRRGDRLPRFAARAVSMTRSLLRSTSVKKTSLMVRRFMADFRRFVRIPFRKISTTTSATFDS